MDIRERLMRVRLHREIFGDDEGPFGGMPDMDEDEMEKVFGPGTLKEPSQIFLEADIIGFKVKEKALRGVLERIHERVLKKEDELKAAEETESKLREKLDKKSYDCHRLEIKVEEHIQNLRAQAEANENRQRELADLQNKFAKIEACLNGGLSKKPLARDMKKVLDEIMAIITAPPESATEQTEA